MMECAEIGHTASRSLDTEKVGNGIKNMFELCNIESLRTICEITASET